MSGVTDGLKPCPFCFKEADYLYGEPRPGRVKIICMACGATSASRDSPELAAVAWNTRHTPSFADQLANHPDLAHGTGCEPPDYTSLRFAPPTFAYKADDPKERYIARLEALLLKLIDRD